jgi:hypothetical protein
MLLQVTQTLINQQNLDQKDMGRWFLVVMGCKFIFNSKEEALAIRETMRATAKWNRIVS